MALKPLKPKQQHKQPKVLCPPKHEDSRNPWSFLELIDAPQWIDLSSEESLMGKEGSDSWFETRRRHHTISLAGLNSNALWLQVDKYSQTKQVKEIAVLDNRNSGRQEVASQLNRMEKFRQFNRPDSSLQSCMKGTQVGWGLSKHIYRTSSAHTRLNRSFNTGCSIPSSTCMSDSESNGRLKKHSSSSDRSSVNSNLQACSIGSDKFSLKTQRSSHGVPCKDSYSITGGSPRSRSSSVASYCAPEPGLRYSTDPGVATISSCEQDWQSPGDREASGQSVVTVTSSASQEEMRKGCASMNDMKKFRDKSVEHTIRRAGGSSTLNKNLLPCKQNTIRALKKQASYSGKENVPPKVKSGNSRAANPFDGSAPLTIASTRTATGKVNVLLESSKFPSKTGVSQCLKSGIQERKISVARELPDRGLAHEGSNKSEQDLAALVAQHNEKIRILGLQQGRKVLESTILLGGQVAICFLVT